MNVLAAMRRLWNWSNTSLASNVGFSILFIVNSVLCILPLWSAFHHYPDVSSALGIIAFAADRLKARALGIGVLLLAMVDHLAHWGLI